MKMKMKLALVIIGLGLSGGAWAADDQSGQQTQQGQDQKTAGDEVQAASLEDLLKMVKEGRVENQADIKARERRFLADKDKQAQAVKDAKQMQADEEARSTRLENQFDQNEQKIASLQDLLSKRLGSLRELFGVLQQVSGHKLG